MKPQIYSVPRSYVAPFVPFKILYLFLETFESARIENQKVRNDPKVTYRDTLDTSFVEQFSNHGVNRNAYSTSGAT